MPPIRTIDDIVRLIYPKMPTKAGQRAIREGVVHAFGGFAAAAGFLPSWIVVVESRRGSSWVIQVQVDSAANRYRVRWIGREEIPWDRWLGNDPRYKTRLWRGDGIARREYQTWKDHNGHLSPSTFFIETTPQTPHHLGGQDLQVDSARVRNRDYPANTPELGTEGGQGPRKAQD